MMLVQTLLDHLETRRQETEAEIRQQTGSASVCQVHKDGRVTGGLKYHEGRLVALSDLVRDLKRSAADRDAITALLAAAAARWEAQLARHQASERPSILWVAYTQGGVDAVVEIQHLLETIDAPGA
jgi:hypothetical protein